MAFHLIVVEPCFFYARNPSELVSLPTLTESNSLPGTPSTDD